MKDLKLLWDDFVITQSRSGSQIYYNQYSVSPNKYFCTFATALYYGYCYIDETDEITDFETNYKTRSISAASEDGAIAKALSLIAPRRAMPVEIKSPLGRPGTFQWTIATHDWSDKTTWWQYSTAVTNEHLTANGNYTIYSSAHTFWVNIDNPKVFVQEYNSGPPYYVAAGVWEKDGTLGLKSKYQPVIKVDGNIVTSGYSIDYPAGAIHFDIALTVNAVVTVNYWYAGSSRYVLRPRSGYAWIVPRCEVQMTDGLVLVNSMDFDFWEDPNYEFSNPAYRLLQMRYQSIAQLIIGSTTVGDTYPGFGGTEEVIPEIENGWGRGYKRGTSQSIIDIPYEYRVPFTMLSSASDCVTIKINGDVPCTGADFFAMTFYCEEEPCD